MRDNNNDAAKTNIDNNENSSVRRARVFLGIEVMVIKTTQITSKLQST